VTGRLSVGWSTIGAMCRNIRVLHNFEPPASGGEVHDAALQYVRKISGSASPSQANAAAFERAVAAVAEATRALLDELVTTAPPKDREVEAAKARQRAAVRYGTG
jgi:hypothetical protein